jgi:hypothetical protein
MHGNNAAFTFMERVFGGSLINIQEFSLTYIKACQEVIYEGLNLLQKDIIQN